MPRVERVGGNKVIPNGYKSFFLGWLKCSKIGDGRTTVNIIKTIELYNLRELYGMWITSQYSCYSNDNRYWGTTHTQKVNVAEGGQRKNN